MRSFILAGSVLLLTTASALADSGPTAIPVVPDSTVPAWVFYWVLGLGTLGGGALLTVIKVLWDKASQVSGLSAEERNRLNQLHEWHNKVDGDQVPLWYTPRAWSEQLKTLQQDHKAFTTLLGKMAGQYDEIIVDLRQQLRSRVEAHDKMHIKMLRLAVRVQQAVEALATLSEPKITSSFSDDEDDDEEGA